MSTPACTFPSCRCEWDKRSEHCPRYGGTTKGLSPKGQVVTPIRSYADEHGDPGGYGGES